MLNGNRPRIAHDIWYNAGRVSNNYGKGYTRDIGGNYLFTLTLKQKHHVKFGAEITKTKQTYYKMAPVGLWELMRQLTNRHIDQLDTDNPYLLIGGTIYQYDDPNVPSFGQNDTILYERKYIATQQSYFDKSLRKKLGLEETSTDVLNTDALTPDFYSLEMFSPDELLNNGNPYWEAMGYDHLGNKISGSDYADFFFKKDANGNYARPQQAYEPNYFAAYSEYQFYHKWLDVRAGLRIDRFDANQPVLLDEYSLYKIKTAGEVNSLNGSPVSHPANIESDAAVYIDDNYNPTEILGYRSGDDWYGPDGSAIDPRFIAQGSSTGRINPYLDNADENIQSPDFNYDGSFKDYEPVVNLLPHIQLEGKPLKQTRLYARYFAVAQNPEYYNWFRAGDYYFFNENINTTIFNSAMKPMRVDRFIAGIRQKIYRQLSADFSYYRLHVVNALGLERIMYAFPRNYTTYTNLPKETTQGLVASLFYQSEKSAGLNVAMHYNWQPDGYIEHTFNGYAQFNFGYGSDYIGWKTKKGRMPLEGLGVSLFCNLRQGIRYIEQANATADALISQSTRRIPTGTIDGKQLPLFYNLDFKAEKGFSLASGKMHLSVYVWIQNLLNTKNLFYVYPYTGKPDDDGYLTSPAGQQDLSVRANAESFSDQYTLKLKDPANVDAPRIIRWGMVISFR